MLRYQQTYDDVKSPVPGEPAAILGSVLRDFGSDLRDIEGGIYQRRAIAAKARADAEAQNWNRAQTIADMERKSGEFAEQQGVREAEYLRKKAKDEEDISVRRDKLEQNMADDVAVRSFMSDPEVMSEMESFANSPRKGLPQMRDYRARLLAIASRKGLGTKAVADIIYGYEYDRSPSSSFAAYQAKKQDALGTEDQLWSRVDNLTKELAPVEQYINLSAPQKLTMSTMNPEESKLIMKIRSRIKADLDELIKDPRFARAWRKVNEGMPSDEGDAVQLIRATKATLQELQDSER